MADQAAWKFTAEFPLIEREGEKEKKEKKHVLNLTLS